MALQISADVNAALEASSTAMAVFAKMPRSHQNEYLKWIEEAKQPDTRQRRITSMIERLSTKDAG